LLPELRVAQLTYRIKKHEKETYEEGPKEL
jgi:hypothetical protein